MKKSNQRFDLGKNSMNDQIMGTTQILKNTQNAQELAFFCTLNSIKFKTKLLHNSKRYAKLMVIWVKIYYSGGNELCPNWGIYCTWKGGIVR
jgi:hypothetical protein